MGIDKILRENRGTGMGKILVVGGAGYIGSHMNMMLRENSYNLLILDDFSTGYPDALRGENYIQGSLGDSLLLKKLFQEHEILAVMHFGAFIQVGESVKNPAKYYQNNLVNTLNLLNAMREAGVDKFVFSSTAAVFGEPQYVPIDERHPKNPVNPYGRSKWMIEQILADYEIAYGLKSVILRYFNAAGADPLGRVGERHEPETHLIPLVLEAILGKRESISVYGRDYDTPDGTCIRDYVHVSDLCAAHLLALAYLLGEKNQKNQKKLIKTRAYNLGNGSGFSVQQVIDIAMKITGRPLNIKEAPRREGDPARLIADSALAKSELGWEPKYSDLEKIIEHAWNWSLQQNLAVESGHI
jgi:UDP-glucose 4-epimerase